MGRNFLGYKFVFVWFYNVCFGVNYVGNVIWFGWGVNFYYLLKFVFVLYFKISSEIFLYFGS